MTTDPRLRYLQLAAIGSPCRDAGDVLRPRHYALLDDPHGSGWLSLRLTIGELPADVEWPEPPRPAGPCWHASIAVLPWVPARGHSAGRVGAARLRETWTTECLMACRKACLRALAGVGDPGLIVFHPGPVSLDAFTPAIGHELDRVSAPVLGHGRDAR